ncbi:extracellular solute-binding protein [soil metagenome]
MKPPDPAQRRSLSHHNTSKQETRPMKTFLTTTLSAAAIALMTAATPLFAQTPWAIDKAAAPLKGTKIKVMFLDRPGYRAIIKLLPEFEKQTGIKVNYEIVPYENAREKQVLNFTSKGDLTIALVDLVWIGEFAESGWIVPVDNFTKDAAITDPNLNLNGFFPLLLKAFGSWDGKVYGLPFDNYSGLLFYNQCMLKDAGFDKPPQSWDEVMNVYAPKLNKPEKKQYAFALQSLRGETQSADSFMRFLWPFGGSLLDKDFKSNLMSKESQAGLKFRQDLQKYMPPGVVSFDHAEAVNALAQGQVAMITEWSAFYGTLTDPKTSKLGDCLGVAPEPKGPAGRLPALGGFSLAVASQATPVQQKASWMFIEWATSEAIAKPYVEAGGVSGRMAVYKDPAVQAKFKYVKPMVESWQAGVPEYRPRFPAWSSITENVAEFGSKMMLGEVSIEQGSKDIGSRMEATLKKEGYYDGKKKKLQ